METTYGPRARAFALPNVAHVVNAGDFEAVVSFGVGLMRRTRILRTTQLRDPARFVVDVAAGLPDRPGERRVRGGRRRGPGGARPIGRIGTDDTERAGR